MENIFFKLINMSLAASVAAVVVIVLRLILKKAPKRISVALWILVALRLILPFFIESTVSLMPSAAVAPDGVVSYEKTYSGGTSTDIVTVANPFGGDKEYQKTNSNTSLSTEVIVWLGGMAAMLAYALTSYLAIRKKVSESVPLEGNIRLSDRISTPFIIGILRPRIYLPTSMNEADVKYVTAHEKAHLRRGDHIWKPLGFLLLTVYWFNPVMWLAYILLCCDIELACDEKVIAELGAEIKKPYSDALLNCSAPRRSISACPLAFGETGVKQRIKNVLSYKKPAFWIIAVALVLCIAASVCFLTNPIDNTLDIKTASYVEKQIIAQESPTLYHEANDFFAVSYKVLSVKKRGNSTEIYMVALYENYVYKNGLSVISGGSGPMVITAQKTDNGYTLKEYWTPSMGADYSKSINERFPLTLRYDALGSSKYAAELIEENRQKAAAHYGVSVNDLAAEPQDDTSTSTTAVTFSESYAYTSNKDRANLLLDSDKKTFTFTSSWLSSYAYTGTYKADGKYVTLSCDDGKSTFVFKVTGDDLVFDASRSSKMPMYKYSGTDGSEAEVCVPDGARFVKD